MRTALVLGGGKGVWAEAGEALSLFSPSLVVAVNDIGVFWPGRIDIWATLHPEKLADWRNARRARCLPPAAEHVAHEGQASVDRVQTYIWPGMNASGSSGLYAVKLALEAGAERVILAGVPMTTEAAHFFAASPWGEREGFIDAWRIAMPRIADKTRSMSGWTQEILGAPTPVWLAGDPRP